MFDIVSRNVGTRIDGSQYINLCDFVFFLKVFIKLILKEQSTNIKSCLLLTEVRKELKK